MPEMEKWAEIYGLCKDQHINAVIGNQSVLNVNMSTVLDIMGAYGINNKECFDLVIEAYKMRVKRLIEDN